MNTYELPFFQRSNLKWTSILIYAVGGVGLSFLTWYAFFSVFKEAPLIGLIGGLSSVLLAIFCIYVLVCAVFLKRFYISLTSETFSFHIGLQRRSIRLDEIEEVNLYADRNGLNLAILLRNSKKSTVIRDLKRIPFTFSIPLDMFGNLDVEKFINTINTQLQLEGRDSTIPKAYDIKFLLVVFVISVLVGYLYQK